MIRGVRTPPESRLHPVALLEDEESIQVALMEVINALLRNTIDPKRAALILRALNIATLNIRHMKYGIHDKEMIKEVPDYPAPPEPELESVPAPAQWSVNMTPAEVAAKIRADHAASTAQVRTDAPVRPGDPDSPGRSALPSSAAPASPQRKPPHVA